MNTKSRVAGTQPGAGLAEKKHGGADFRPRFPYVTMVAGSLPPVDIADADKSHVLIRVQADRRVVGIKKRHAIESPGPFVQPLAVMHEVNANIRVLLQHVLAEDLQPHVAKSDVGQSPRLSQEGHIGGAGLIIRSLRIDVSVVDVQKVGAYVDPLHGLS